jgi:hypothetical protein
MEVNIMPWNLAYTLEYLRSCSSGHILECQGVVSVVTLTIDKIEVNLDFHIFDILDSDLLLGYLLEKLLEASQGSLDE